MYADNVISDHGADAQADMIIGWAHMSEGTFVVAHFLNIFGSICFVVKICVHPCWKINIRLNWQLLVHNVLASTLKYYMYAFFDSKDK